MQLQWFGGTRQSRARGLSLIELLIVIAVGIILVGALSLFVGRSFSISREQIEQVRITEDARLQIERVSETVRNARYIDKNTDLYTEGATEAWLQGADDYDISVFTNADTDAEPELVRYFIESGSTELKRVVSELDAAGATISTGAVQTLLTSVRNRTTEPTVPLFTYYATGDPAAPPLTAPVSTTIVVRVGIRLLVDVLPTQYPSATEVVTVVSPRPLAVTSGTTTGTGVSLQYDYTDSFAEEAYTDCVDFCGISGTPQCDAWTTTFSWSGDTSGTVDAYCYCAATYLPPEVQSQTSPVAADSYTTYMRSCWEGGICTGGYRGTPYCDAGCFTGPGECACACP